jgi:hypothetical protein
LIRGDGRRYSRSEEIPETVVKKPCTAHLDTAKELLEHGVIGEGAQALVDLRRCAGDCGCEDWQNCDATIQDAWREVAHKPLPEARPRPKGGDPG